MGFGLISYNPSPFPRDTSSFLKSLSVTFFIETRSGIQPVRAWRSMFCCRMQDIVRILSCSVQDITRILSCGVQDTIRILSCIVQDITRILSCTVQDITRILSCSGQDIIRILRCLQDMKYIVVTDSLSLIQGSRSLP